MTNPRHFDRPPWPLCVVIDADANAERLCLCWGQWRWHPEPAVDAVPTLPIGGPESVMHYPGSVLTLVELARADIDTGDRSASVRDTKAVVSLTMQRLQDMHAHIRYAGGRLARVIGDAMRELCS